MFKSLSYVYHNLIIFYLFVRAIILKMDKNLVTIRMTDIGTRNNTNVQRGRYLIDE